MHYMLCLDCMENKNQVLVRKGNVTITLGPETLAWLDALQEAQARKGYVMKHPRSVLCASLMLSGMRACVKTWGVPLPPSTPYH
jgi:hypothetical protein